VTRRLRVDEFRQPLRGDHFKSVLGLPRLRILCQSAVQAWIDSPRKQVEALVALLASIGERHLRVLAERNHIFFGEFEPESQIFEPLRNISMYRFSPIVRLVRFGLTS